MRFGLRLLLWLRLHRLGWRLLRFRLGAFSGSAYGRACRSALTKDVPAASSDDGASIALGQAQPAWGHQDEKFGILI